MLLLYSDLAGLLQLAFQFRVLSQLRKCGLVVLKLCKPEANSPHVRCRPSVIQNWLVVWNRFRISSRICHLQQLNYLRNDSQFLWQWAPVLIKGTTTWAPSLHSFPVPLLSSLCHSLHCDLSPAVCAQPYLPHSSHLHAQHHSEPAQHDFRWPEECTEPQGQQHGGHRAAALWKKHHFFSIMTICSAADL